MMLNSFWELITILALLVLTPEVISSSCRYCDKHNPSRGAYTLNCYNRRLALHAEGESEECLRNCREVCDDICLHGVILKCESIMSSATFTLIVVAILLVLSCAVGFCVCVFIKRMQRNDRRNNLVHQGVYYGNANNMETRAVVVEKKVKVYREMNGSYFLVDPDQANLTAQPQSEVLMEGKNAYQYPRRQNSI